MSGISLGFVVKSWRKWSHMTSTWFLRAFFLLCPLRKFSNTQNYKKISHVQNVIVSNFTKGIRLDAPCWPVQAPGPKKPSSVEHPSMTTKISMTLKICEASEDKDDEDFKLLWRKYFRDLGFVLEDDDHDVVLWLSVLGLVFWYSFFSPRSSFQPLEHLGAFGQNRYRSVLEISTGSIATKTSSLNSKSPAEAYGSGFFDEYSATGEGLFIF